MVSVTVAPPMPSIDWIVRPLVEQREAVAAAGRQALRAQVDARLVDVGARHHDRAAAARELVLDALRVELLRDRARVLAAEAGIERRVVGLGRPLHERHAREHHRHDADERDRLLARSEAVADPVL
jgi:hypothetical protein